MQTCDGQTADSTAPTRTLKDLRRGLIKISGVGRTVNQERERKLK